ncbi:MAG: glucoamylase family protein, partial [Bacillota bacterium]
TRADATGYQGFYYHFLNMKTGKREWNSELSTIDTAWLIAGIRFAMQYYNGDNEAEKEIRDLGEKITNRINWNWMIIKKGRNDNHTGLISMAWKPDEGILNFGWYGYTEALYLYILAAGTNLKNPTETYQRWLNTYSWKEPYPGLSHVVFPPLFGHQYSHMFIDFRNLTDKYLKEKGIDYFENSLRASLTNRKYCIDNPQKWAGYDSLTWGISACDGPGDKYNKGNIKFEGYAGRGTSGPDSVYSDDGTIAPTASAASIVFIPEVVIPTLKNLYQKYGNKGLWDKYGFKDAFNPTAGWYDSDYLGLDQGPIVIMIENFRTGLVWKYSMQDPLIKKGLERLGFEQLSKAN